MLHNMLINPMFLNNISLGIIILVEIIFYTCQTVLSMAFFEDSTKVGEEEMEACVFVTGC